MTTTASDTPIVEDSAVLDYDDLMDVLEPTEGLDERLFQLGEDNLNFVYVAGDSETDTEPKLRLRINSEMFDLTGSSATQAFSTAKLSKTIIEAYDIEVLLPLVNWFYENQVGELKALIKDRTIVAFTRPSLTIYSMKDFVDEMLRSLGNFDVDEFVFEKVSHSLEETSICMVVPHLSRVLTNGDVLRAGVHIQHSVVGKKPLVLTGYVSRDVHGNGMLSQQATLQWDRKQDKRPEVFDGSEDHFDVYTWAYDTTDTILRIFKREVKDVEFLQEVEMGGHTGTLFNDVFSKSSIPAAAQKVVREEYVDQPGQTLYDLWSSLTLAADRDEIENPATSKKLMTAAGLLVAHPQSCPSCHRLTDEVARD